MVTLVNRAKMSITSTGTGTPITLGSAEDGYQSFADAGVSNGDVVRYVIEDGDNWKLVLAHILRQELRLHVPLQRVAILIIELTLQPML